MGLKLLRDLLVPTCEPFRGVSRRFAASQKSRDRGRDEIGGSLAPPHGGHWGRGLFSLAPASAPSREPPRRSATLLSSAPRRHARTASGTPYYEPLSGPQGSRRSRHVRSYGRGTCSTAVRGAHRPHSFDGRSLASRVALLDRAIPVDAWREERRD